MHMTILRGLMYNGVANIVILFLSNINMFLQIIPCLVLWLFLVSFLLLFEPSRRIVCVLLARATWVAKLRRTIAARRAVAAVGEDPVGARRRGPL